MCNAVVWWIYVYKYGNEVDVLPSFAALLQYHALGLLYHIRKNDRLAVNKMLNKFMRHGLKSPFAYCMMIRVASKLLEEEAGGWEKHIFLSSEPGL